MSRADFKPVPCKQGCGKDVVWERDTNGKWLPPFEFDVENWVKLERHMCPNYKPKPKPFEKRGEWTNWAGTNKQGQFIEARESPQTRPIEGITKKDLDELLGLCREILITVKNIYDAKPPVWEDLTDDEIKKVADTEKIDEPQISTPTADKEDDYGF